MIEMPTCPGCSSPLCPGCRSFPPSEHCMTLLFLVVPRSSQHEQESAR